MTDLDYEPTSDYDDQMEGVRLGLLSYDDTHCRHGVFIGHPYGPDYMCFWCEMGVSDEEYEAEMAERARARVRKYRSRIYFQVILRLMRRHAPMPDGPEKAALWARIERHVQFWSQI